MFSKILVPVDLGHIEKSGKMLEQAKALSANGQVEVSLLNVIPELPTYVSAELPAGLHEKTMAFAQTDLNKLVKEYDLPASTKISVVHGKRHRYHESSSSWIAITVTVRQDNSIRPVFRPTSSRVAPRDRNRCVQVSPAFLLIPI